MVTIGAVRFWVSIFPYHAFYLSRIPLGRCGLDADGDLVSWRIKHRSVSQYAPRHACMLVRKRDGGLIPMHAFGHFRRPITKAEVRPAMQSHHDDLRRLNEQHSQIPAAALRYASTHCSSSGAILSGHKSNPGRKIASAIKGLSLTNRRHHRWRDYRTNARDRHEVDVVLFDFLIRLAGRRGFAKAAVATARNSPC